MNNSKKSQRQLAAILFADIVGYTRIMQQNEEKALQRIHRFQHILNECATESHGTILKNYGDGSLLTFSNSLEAVQCAIEIQKKCNLLNPPLLLRIGIHVGEFIVHDDDIYGNGVNLASRIQSFGSSGSILFSDNVYQKIKNHPEFRVEKLGKQKFKNVAEKVELFALTNDGLSIPQVRPNIEPSVSSKLISSNTWLAVVAFIVFGLVCWKLIIPIFINGAPDIKERIAILEFVNETGDPSLDFIGRMISDMASHSFAASGEVEINNFGTLSLGKNYVSVLQGRMGYTPEFASDIGVDKVLEGRYYKHDDFRITIYGQLVEANSGKLIIPFEEDFVDNKNPVAGIANFVQKILGYWSTKDNELFAFDKPKADAYKSYIKATSLWEQDYDQALYHLDDCLKKDSLFVRAQLLKLGIYRMVDQFEKLDSLLELLRPQYFEMSPYERILYQFYNTYFEGNNKIAYDYLLEEYALAPKDLFVNNSAAILSMNLVNSPERVLDVVNDFVDNDFDLNECFHCRDRINVHASALIDIGKFNKAIQLIQRHPSEPIDMTIKELEIRALVKLGQVDRINSIIENSRFERFTYSRGAPYLLLRTAGEFAIVRNKEMRDHFGNRALAEFTPAQTWDDYKRIAQLNMIMENYPMAEKNYRILDQQYSAVLPKLTVMNNSFHLAELACALGYQGKNNEASAIMDSLEVLRPNYSFGIVDYYKSRIHLSMNQKEDALKFLKKSIREGKEFYQGNFQHDFLFIDLFDHPEFENSLKVYQ